MWIIGMGSVSHFLPPQADAIDLDYLILDFGGRLIRN